MKKSVILVVYLLLSSYLNVGFVGFSEVRAQGNVVFFDDFNDNSLDTTKWTEEMAGSGNTYSEENGEAHFTTYGHRTGSYTTEHAFLKSKNIGISDWSSVTFSGRWKFADPGTAEMWFRVYDPDTGKYIGVRYVSWTRTVAYDRPEGTVSDSRNAPQTYVSFRIVLYRDHFEYWEDGTLVKTVPTTGMENVTTFYLLIGGWDDTPTDSHIYFDDIAVEYLGGSEAPLKITITSPEERVYNTTQIWLNVTSNKPVDEWRYSLNGAGNVTFEPNTTIEAAEEENSLTVYATAGNETASARVSFYVDTTPPGTVENLTHEAGTDYIRWSWDNPKDEDFSEVLVYIDGKFQGKTGGEEWFLEELSPGETHTIGLLTEDGNGNINTTWVNDTATTLVPSERVYVNESGWWYEGGTFNPSESPLSEGISAAPAEGTVVVMAGNYKESIEVDKPLTLEARTGVVLEGDGSKRGYYRPVILINSDNVTVSGFTLNSSLSNVGIWANSSHNCLLMNNTIAITESSEDERYGVYLSHGTNNTARNNAVVVDGFQGTGVYVYYEGGSIIEGNRVNVTGDGSSGIEVFYSKARVKDNEVQLSEIAGNPGYGLYLYLAGDSSVENNGITTNLSEGNSWAINVVGAFNGSLAGNVINGIKTEVVSPGDFMIRGVSPENRPAPPEGYGSVGIYLEVQMDWWTKVGVYYNDSTIKGLREDSLAMWNFLEGWSRDGISEDELDTAGNFISANVTVNGILAPLAQEERDTTPPVLTFVPPTPENGSLIGNSTIVVNITASEDLSSATLDLDGTNHTMSGSGRGWWYSMVLPDGRHSLTVYGSDLAGNEGKSGTLTFEVDTTAPVYVLYGQSREGIPPGESVVLHSLWSDEHLSYSLLWTNVTGSWEVFDEGPFVDSWANFTISLDEPGTYCWYIEAFDELEHSNKTPVECFEVYSPPRIVSYSPETPVESYVGEEVKFSVSFDQVVNVKWYLGEEIAKNETGVNFSDYATPTLPPGEYSLRVVATNANGSVSHSWTWYVYERPSLSITFVHPTPENGAMLNVRRVFINVSSSVELENATLEWNGINESMSGSGKSWWALKDNLPDGSYSFRVYGRSGDLENSTEIRRVTIDATPPGVLFYGESREVVIEGDSVRVFAKWLDEHLSSAVLWTNASEGFEWTERPLEIRDGWSNWTIETGEDFAGKTFCWYIVANDTFGNENETETLCFRVEERLKIVTFEPEAEEVTLWDNESASFSVELNKEANVSWFVNESLVLGERGTESVYTNSSLVPGIWNVSVKAERGNESVAHWWILHVREVDRIPPSLWFVSPTPENGSLLANLTVKFKVVSSEDLRGVVLYVDEVPKVLEGSGRSWSVTINLGDGTHTFYATGEDLHGNKGSTEHRKIEIDTRSPEYVIWGQSKDSILQGEKLNVYSLWREDHPTYSSLKIRKGLEGEWVEIRSMNYSTWANFTLSSSNLEPGLYCWIVTVFDVFGRENSTPPECFEVRERLALLSATPEGKEVESYDNESVNFAIVLNQVANITWFVNGTAVLKATGNVSTYSDSNISPGLWNITVLAVNGNGSVTRTWLLMRIDVTPPVLWFCSPTPSNGSIIRESNVMFVVVSNEQLKRVLLEINGVNYTMSGGGNSWYLNVSLEDGSYTFRAYGEDAYGNWNSTGHRTFEIDTREPVITVNAPDRVERGSNATARIILNELHPTQYTVFLNGIVVSRGTYSDGDEITLDLPTEHVGTLSYSILAFDAAGNSAHREFEVEVVDTTPPVLTFLPPTPENGSIINSVIVELRIAADEDLRWAKLRSNDSRFDDMILHRESGYWKITLRVPDGMYIFRVLGADAYGNVGDSGPIEITVDSTPPILHFKKPTPDDGSLLGSCNVTFAINASERLKAALLEVDGVNLSMTEKNGTWYSSLCLEDGSHYFMAYGSDLAGNWKGSAKRSISIDTLAPEVEERLVNLTVKGWDGYSLYVTVERKSSAGVLLNATDAHPGYYEVVINGLVIHRKEYQSGVPFFVEFNTSDVGTIAYILRVVDALGRVGYEKGFLVEVKDTTPPEKVPVLEIYPYVGGADVEWVNPGDDDFDHVELWVNSTLVANFTGVPGSAGEHILTLTPGKTYNISLIPVDVYGNRGEPRWESVLIPYPKLDVKYVLPTPENGSELPSTTKNITIRAESEFSFASCSIIWDDREYTAQVKPGLKRYIDERGHWYSKTIFYCEKTFFGHLSGEHHFNVIVGDGYGHFKNLGERHFKVFWPCFDGCKLSITSPQGRNYMTLLIPVNFSLESNAPPVSYTLTIDNIGLEIPFIPTLDEEFRNGNLYLTGNGLLNLTPYLYKLKNPITLILTVTGPCGNTVEDGVTFTVCRDNEQPKLKVDMKEEYRPGERIVPKVAARDKNNNLEGVYVSINGGPYRPYRDGEDLSGELRAYSLNVVRLKAVDKCGAYTEVIKRIRVIGPPARGNWIINGSQVCSAREYKVNGSLLITENGSLEMSNCRLTITGGVEVNGTLRVLENSFIGGESLFLSAKGGKIEVSHSELNGFSRGTFEGGNASFERSLLAGEFTFRFSNVSIVESEVNGGVTASGSLTVIRSRFHGGTGLSYERTGQGVLVIKDSNFTNSDYGIKFSGVASDWSWEMENLLVENNRYAGFYLEAPRYGYSTELLRNVTVRNNPLGIYARNVRLRVENSNVSSNGANFVLHLGWNWIFIVNSTVGGSDRAFQAWETGGIELWDTNVSGSVDPDADRFIVHVTRGATVRIEDGRAKNFQGYVDGKLVMKSYTAENGIIKVSPGGKLIVEDRDGIPATEAMDRDASRLVNMNVTGMANGRGESQLILLNSVLRDSNVHTNSREAIVKGCSIEGGSLAFTTSPGVSRNLIISEVFGDNAEWYYSTTELGNSWVYTPSTEGMQPGNGPFAANIYSSGFTSGTEVGEFTGLYLKRVFNLTELPVQAWLDYYAISGVEIYVNGRKVVDEIDHRAQLSFTQGWGGGRITAHPLTRLVDVAGYLRQGRNVIAVHVRNPNEYPYPGLGAFKARLSVVTGAAGVTDSRIKARIGGGRAMLILARDEMMGNVTALSNSWLRISDSTVHGGVRVYGHLELLRSIVEGNGTGTGVMAQAPFEILLNGSRVRNFECGINASPWGTKSKLEVYSSEISGNNVGIALFYSSLIFESSYLVHNGVGMEMGKVDGMIHNSLLFDNGKAVTFPFGPNWNFTFDHNTVIGNGIGIEFTEHGDRPFSATNNLIQDNGIGVSIRAHVNAIFTNNSLINGKDIYVSSIGTPPRLTHTDWGGHEPKMVEDYPSGTMYTASGEAEENYDILSLAKGMKPGDTVETGSNWGSDLLLARLSIHPEENGTVRGVVSLEGIASSSSGVSLVNYSLIINGTEELLKESEVNDAVYHDYVTLNTVARNLTGTGYIKFTAKDGNGMSVSSVRKVYFGNAEIRIESYSVSHPTALYVYRKVSDNGRKVMPYEERFANVTVRLANIGSFDGAAKIELVLPEYIERHTGRVSLIVAIPANMSGDFHALVPITVYNPITLTWDPLPEELPESGKIPMEIRLYDMDGILRDSRTTEIGFDIGPVFRLEKYDAYVLTRSWCQNSGECHEKNYGRGVYTYDGDGDGILEAAESHHFNFMVENIGTREVYLEGMTFFDCIPERDPYHANKVLKRNSVTILNKGSGVFLSDVTTDNLRKFLGPGEKMWANGVWMPWWDDRPPRVIPPVNFSGEYMSTVFVYYRESRDGLALPQVYLSPAVNYRRTPVASLNKTFEQFTEFVGPIKVDVIGINGDKTYLRLKNTNDNVYYNYYAEGYYDLDPEGYVWYHAIPPGFEFKVTVGHSRMPDSVIPHYRVTVGAEHSLLFNEIHLIAIGAEGALKVYDIDVPVETLVMALVKAFLKITNIVENLDFPSDQTIAEYSRSSSAAQVNEMLSHDNSTIVPLSLDDFARWEKEGLNQSYYYKMEHFSEQPLETKVELFTTLGKAIVTDEDMQALFIETVLEVIDNDALNDIYEVIQAIREGNADKAESNGMAIEQYGLTEDDLDEFKKVVKKALVKYVKDEIKKQKSFQELDEEKQKEILDKAGKGVGAAIETAEKLGEWTAYNVIAILTQPLPMDINVLDPPSTYTVEAQKGDSAIIFGGSSGNLDGWGNVSLTFGDIDVYRAHYIVPTPLTRIGPLFNGSFERVSLLIRGQRDDNGMKGTVIMKIKPDARNASALFAIFRNEYFARAFISPYLSGMERFEVAIENNAVVIEGEGTLTALPEDREMSINVTFGKLLTEAVVERKGHYSGTLEVRPAFGVSSENVHVNIIGNVSIGIMENGATIVGAGNLSETLRLNVTPKRLYEGGTLRIIPSVPCSVSWVIGDRSGDGSFVKTSGMEPGNYTLRVLCRRGNSTLKREFTVELIQRPVIRTLADGVFISGGDGKIRVRTRTDLYRIYLYPKGNLTGQLAVYQRAGTIEAPGKYITYAIFNVTHPLNWWVNNATLYFRIPKKWLEINNLSAKQLVLLRREGTWVEYNLTFEYEDLRSAYYRAEVPGLSLYAVAGKLKVGKPESPSPVQGPSAPSRKWGDTLPYAVIAILIFILVGIYAYRRR